MASFFIMKPTLILGASSFPYRYSFLAAQRLTSNNHHIYLLGKHDGIVAGTNIQTNPDEIETPDLDTITIYLNPKNQKEYYDWIIEKNPQRVIFNPGSENKELADILRDHNIEVVEACTLVMLSTGQY